MQVGLGYDVHKLVRGRKLIIGGVEIKHSKGLLGWSDGDVLLHAIIDAILGAMGEGDIGKHFPAGDKKYKNADSLDLLRSVAEMLREKCYALGNIDSTVVAQEPKLAPYVMEMSKKIAEVLDVSSSFVNVKAKTEEGLGFTGKKQGISAYAVCLVHKKVC
ncbi:MAG: 2-C-methyl-D-erythritol 2,4-cyclodiphosphate synthase [bacterium]